MRTDGGKATGRGVTATASVGGSGGAQGGFQAGHKMEVDLDLTLDNSDGDSDVEIVDPKTAAATPANPAPSSRPLQASAKLKQSPDAPFGRSASPARRSPVVKPLPSTSPPSSGPSSPAAAKDPDVAGKGKKRADSRSPKAEDRAAKRQKKAVSPPASPSPTLLNAGKGQTPPPHPTPPLSGSSKPAQPAQLPPASTSASSLTAAARTPRRPSSSRANGASAPASPAPAAAAISPSPPRLTPPPKPATSGPYVSSAATARPRSSPDRSRSPRQASPPGAPAAQLRRPSPPAVPSSPKFASPRPAVSASSLLLTLEISAEASGSAPQAAPRAFQPPQLPPPPPVAGPSRAAGTSSPVPPQQRIGRTPAHLRTSLRNQACHQPDPPPPALPLHASALLALFSPSTPLVLPHPRASRSARPLSRISDAFDSRPSSPLSAEEEIEVRWDDLRCTSPPPHAPKALVLVNEDDNAREWRWGEAPEDHPAASVPLDWEERRLEAPERTAFAFRPLDGKENSRLPDVVNLAPMRRADEEREKRKARRAAKRAKGKGKEREVSSESAEPRSYIPGTSQVAAFRRFRRIEAGEDEDSSSDESGDEAVTVGIASLGLPILREEVVRRAARRAAGKVDPEGDDTTDDEAVGG
ncbi:hypothetical protein JCM10213v2_000359 [Rhodosporidiobolus nylandii]